jgi:hypothetical protein
MTIGDCGCKIWVNLDCVLIDVSKYSSFKIRYDALFGKWALSGFESFNGGNYDLTRLDTFDVIKKQYDILWQGIIDCCNDEPECCSCECHTTACKDDCCE